MMKKMKAVVWTQADLDHVQIQDVDIPPTEPGDVLIKNVAVPINPVDWKAPVMGMVTNFPLITGVDCAGFVAKVGQGVTKWKVGDAVFGFSSIKDPDYGRTTFAEYCRMKGDMILRKPNNLSFESTSTIPMNMTTAGQAFKDIGFPLIEEGTITSLGNKFLLIWGASSTVGSYAVQLGALNGFDVIATCSPHNFDWVKSLGAKYTLDYNDKNVAKNIKGITDDLQYVIDCVGSKTEPIAETLSSKGNPKLASVLKPPSNLPSHCKTFQVWGAKPHDDPREAEWYHLFWNKYLPLIEKGTFKPQRVEVLHGLEGIILGMKNDSEHKVSGKKQVALLSSHKFESTGAL